MEAKQIVVALEGLDNIFKIGSEINSDCNPYVLKFSEIDGIATLENLQYHENQNVYDKALYVLEKYIGEDDDIDMMNLPHDDIGMKQI